MRISSRHLRLAFCLAAISVSAAPYTSAQVLARPNWAGSGVAVEAWWKRAVFYRIDPTTFQDSDGDGIGDLNGLVQRLDYLQQLGVDAVILTQPRQGPPLSTDDVGTFVRKAAESHVRVLVELPSADPAQARAWLNQGIAGLFVDMRAQSTHGATAASIIRELRRVTDSFPGGRVLLANGILPAPDGAQLSVDGSFSSVQSGAAFLRDRLENSLESANVTGTPLLEITGLNTGGAGDQSQQAIAERALATLVFASRAAVIFDAGRELGLQSPEGKPVPMQWTPSNITHPPTPEPNTPLATPAPKKPTTPQPEVYGTYTPYVPPKPKPIQPMPTPVAASAEPTAPPPPDPDTLPGFTTGDVPANEAPNGTTANAAVEDTNPNSLLNFYRHLIALHHDNGSLHNGSETLFDRDELNTLIWVRRAPAGSRTAASVVIACNLSDRPATLSLSGEFTQMHIRGGALRPLLTASAAETPAASIIIPLQTAEHLSLPPYSVFLGELYHSSADEPAPSLATHRTTRKRHHR